MRVSLPRKEIDTGNESEPRPIYFFNSGRLGDSLQNRGIWSYSRSAGSLQRLKVTTSFLFSTVYCLRRFSSAYWSYLIAEKAQTREQVSNYRAFSGRCGLYKTTYRATIKRAEDCLTDVNLGWGQAWLWCYILSSQKLHCNSPKLRFFFAALWD